MLELGGLLTAGSLLLASILGPIFRRASPPRWTNVPLVPELATVGITGLFAWGIALLAAGGIDIAEHGISVVHLGLLLAVIVGGILLRRWLLRRAGPKAPAASA